MIPVILSGGSGTRLWPVSRASYPKQFCDFYDGSFLDNTIRRLKDFGDIHILTTRDMASLTQRAVKAGGLNPKHVIFEPFGKNTGPAVALLCHVLNLQGQAQEIVGVFPSDHLIADEALFTRAVKLAEKMATQGYIATLGITPHSASTGYGYIEVGDVNLGGDATLQAREVQGFREKPSAATAQAYLESGHHFWNAGMFVFRVQQMMEHFTKYQPQMWQKITQIKADLSDAEYNYALVDSISFDYAIMEKATAKTCIPCDLGWSDVGSWDEVARLTDETPQLRSQSMAQLFNQDSENNFVFSVQNKVVGLVDVTDMIVVDTPDALLLAHKGSSQKVKELVTSMREANLPEATEHPFEARPWGGFEIIDDRADCKVKRITVDPGGQLSYQSHQQRSEHWVIVAGEAHVIVEEREVKLGPGQSVHIPAGNKHRIRNSGSAALIFVEVQTGTYFGEDDIVRYLDDYNRVPS